jgi:hypothetical protein
MKVSIGPPKIKKICTNQKIFFDMKLKQLPTPTTLHNHRPESTLIQTGNRFPHQALEPIELGLRAQSTSAGWLGPDIWHKAIIRPRKKRREKFESAERTGVRRILCKFRAENLNSGGFGETPWLWVNFGGMGMS